MNWGFCATPTPFRRQYFTLQKSNLSLTLLFLVLKSINLSNALLPCRLSNLRHSRAIPSATEAAQHLLTQLGIPQSHWHQGVTRLSIGQQQRVAAARALIGVPEIILADEPTSALDSNNRDRFLELLLTLAERSNSSVVFVSHDQSLARHFHHRMALEVAP